MHGSRSARFWLILAVLVGLTLSLPPGGAEGGSRYKRRTSRVSRGVTLARVADSRGPNEIRVLKVNPARRVTIDVGLASKPLPGLATTGRVAAKHRAIAAVNGDFGRSPGRPFHIYAEDGELVQTGKRLGRAFAVSADEKSAYIGRPTVRIRALVGNPVQRWVIDRWNEGAPAAAEIAGYSPVSGSVEGPPKDACSARLLPSGPKVWGGGRQRVVRPYVVDAKLCSSTAISEQGGVVISARRGGAKAALIDSLTVGEALKITWSFGWPGVLDAMGGEPQIIDNGRIVAPTGCGYICWRHPRTGVGITARGKILIVTVDGRQPGRSVGMTLVEFARFLKREGAVEALNLDGGGSTTMVVRGRVVNRPSGGSQRSVANALLVLPRRDRGESVR